jgi:hypothetical protein
VVVGRTLTLTTGMGTSFTRCDAPFLLVASLLLVAPTEHALSLCCVARTSLRFLYGKNTTNQLNSSL